MRYILLALALYVIDSMQIIPTGDSTAEKSIKHKSYSLHSMNIAVCLTGQLARLEIISKIKNFLIPNAIIGQYSLDI